MTGADGRGVLLIGASSAIGQAIARRFSAGGDQVVGVSFDAVSPTPTRADADAEMAEHLMIDCSTSLGADQAVDAAVQLLGRLDVLVLAAAVMPVAPATRTSDEQWRLGVDVTLSGAFFVARRALSELGAGTAIVAVTSVNATLAAPGLPVYAAAKAGVEGLVRQLALEYGPAGVRVNAVAPAMIGNADLQAVTDGYPLRRVGTPADVAGAVCFLASPDAAFITGCVLPIDGGLSISSPAAWLRPDLRSRFL